MKKNSIVGIVLALIATAFVYSVGAATRAGVPGMVFDAIRADLGFSATETAMIASAGVFGCIAFLPIAGFATDFFGWRRVVLVGIFLQVFGEWILYSFCDHFIVCLGSFVNGGGRTIGYLATLKLIETSFHPRFFAPLWSLFYVFSYGGTFFGSELFSRSNSTWQNLLRDCNFFTLAMGFLVAIALLLCRESREGEKVEISRDKKTSFFVAMKKKVVRDLVFRIASSIVIYWTFVAIVAKKFSLDFCGGDKIGVLAMNACSAIGMISGGWLSFAINNRRREIVRVGGFLLAIGCATLLATFIANNIATKVAMSRVAFAMIGAGYGTTGVAICALRENVATQVSSRAIASANFIANLGIIAFTQITGFLYDSFATKNELAINAPAYIIVFAIALAITLPGLRKCCLVK